MSKMRFKRSSTVKVPKSLLSKKKPQDSLASKEKEAPQKVKESVMVFGKPPGKPVEVKFKWD